MSGVRVRRVVLAIAAAWATAYGFQASPAGSQPSDSIRNGPAQSGVRATTGRTKAAPLTAAQKERFEAGREVYQNVCEMCHQADGRGRERLGANLVGSDFAVGPAEIPIRIVLQGKEGDVGVMPPQESMLSNDQIAAVLTYIRRAWGHTASPVDPDAVKRVRRQTAKRMQPWTNEELRAIGKE